MIVREVHTAFEHEVNGKKHIGSFLYLEEVSEWDLERLTKGYRSKIVDPKSKAYLDGKPFFDVMAWFVSVDGNFLVLRHLSMDWEVRQVNTHTIERLDFQLEGDLLDVLTQLRARFQDNPVLARKILKNSGVSRGKLPKRVKFAELRHVGLENLHSQLEEIDPSSATDDLLALAVISGRERDRWGKEILEQCKRECDVRYKMLDGGSGEIFNLRNVSLAELEARSARGKETLWKFNNKFPTVGCLDSRIISNSEWDWQVLDYLRKLSDDVLAELLLAFFASGVEQSVRSKHLYWAATTRQNPEMEF